VTTPFWLADALAVVMVSVAGYCAGRPVVARITGRPTHYSVDLLHVCMGGTMAAMLAPAVGLSHPGAWALVFAVAAGFFGILTGRTLLAGQGAAASGAQAQHLVSSGAMVYMLMAPAAMGAMPGMTMPMTSSMAMTPTSMGGGLRLPSFAVLLAVLLIGMAGYILLRLARHETAHAGLDGEVVLAPRSVACCQVAMNLTMGYMLIMLL